MKLGLTYDITFDKVTYELGPTCCTIPIGNEGKHDYLDIELCLKTDRVMKKAIYEELLKYENAFVYLVRQSFNDYIENNLGLENELFKLKSPSGLLSTHVCVDVTTGGTSKHGGWIKIKLRFWRGNCDIETVQAVILELFKTVEERNHGRRKR